MQQFLNLAVYLSLLRISATYPGLNCRVQQVKVGPGVVKSDKIPQWLFRSTNGTDLISGARQPHVANACHVGQCRYARVPSLPKVLLDNTGLDYLLPIALTVMLSKCSFISILPKPPRFLPCHLNCHFLTQKLSCSLNTFSDCSPFLWALIYFLS